MNHPSLSSVKHEVTYRFIGGSPENGILSCGFMRKKSAQKSQIDFVIPYYSCFLLLQGSGEYWDETGARAALTPGSVCQRLPNRQHSTRVDGDGNWLEFYISFGKGVFDSLKSLELVQETVPVGRFADPRSLLPLFHGLLSRMSAAPDPLLAACLLEAQQLVLTLTRPRDPRPGLSPVVVHACELLEKDSERELPLPMVAERLCVGYETLRKQFQREMHLSLEEYRQSRRMTTAQMMLLEGEPVKAVAKALGYSDAYAFSKQFKRFCGSSPSAYAQSLLQKP